jgi:hypothetical protein
VWSAWSASVRKESRPRRDIIAGGSPRSREADGDVREFTILMIEYRLSSLWCGRCSSRSVGV